MGKHLAPKKKHELNFIKKKPTRVTGHKTVAPAREEERASVFPRRPSAKRLKLPQFDAHPVVFAALAAVLLIAVHFLPLEGWMVPAAYAVPALLCLVEHAGNAYEELKAGRYFNEALLTCAAALALFATGLYTQSVLLLLLTSAVNFAEKRLSERIRAEQDRIQGILPQYATLITEDGTQRVDPATVNPGDILLVAAGERIPLDGVITEGITTVDTAAVSGQRSPWAVNVGYKVYAGCRNLTSDIKIRVSRPFAQSTAKRIVRITDAAADFPSEQENTAIRFQRYYTPAVLALALAVGVLLPIFRGNWPGYIRRAAVLLITGRAAADAFGLSLIYRRACSLSTAMGVFIKGGDCLETMARAETVIFDKTGTITEGRYAVTDAFPVKMSEQQLLTIAAAAESFSRHPIAAAIREAAGKMDEHITRAVRIQEIPGRGVSTLVGKRQIYVGNAALLEEYGIRYNIPARPGTAIHVSVDDIYCGHILVTDKVRRRAFDALETLRINGVKKLVLLTGDVISVARPIASRLNFDMLRAELKPEDKAKAVDYLMKNKGQRSTIAFVGDGENSGKIMTGADVGIAMGSLGSDQALAAADVMIMDRDIFKVPKVFAISRSAYRVSMENLAAGAGVGVLLTLLGVFGVLSPLAAEILSFLLSAALLGNILRIK